ncbi:MAG TPA: endonuclease/exonuclease/phosphatase family protein [Vicinamibacteria bacterium]|nr:endonuclease/exonuclease/phosphatase family protein [Vicinamibacteria bacterium]
MVAFCLFITALTGVYGFVGDKTFWGDWLSIAPSAIWALFLLPTVALLRSRMAFLFLLGFTLATTDWPGHVGARASSPSDTIRVVSWNIGAENAEWADAVRSLKPDIVLVQESSKPLSVWKGFDWYGTPDPGTLTRFPAEILPTEKVGPWSAPQLLLVDVRGRKILVANVHLMLPAAVLQLVDPLEANPLENYRLRVGQFDRLASLIRSTAETTGAQGIILAGDFNTPARMPSLDPLRVFLTDAWTTRGSGWSATMPAFLPLERIDHIWVSPGVEPITVRVVPLDGSDHRAVVADLRVD